MRAAAPVQAPERVARVPVAVRAEPLLTRIPARRFLAIFSLLYVVAILPVVLFEVPSVTDYLNHLARVHVLGSPDGPYYETRWAPLPNLAFDGIVGGLATVMPLPAAGKVFLALALLLPALGTVLLHRQVFGEWSLWPCVSFALLYNRTLLSGLAGYVFGVGLCLLATAAWLRWRTRPPWQRLALGVALSMALYFAHFLALAVYGLIVVAIELAEVRASPPGARRAALRGLAATALQGLPPLLLFLLATPRAHGPVRIAFRSLWSRIEAFAAPVWVYDPVLDVALAALLLLAVVHGIRTRRLAAPRGIVWAIVALSAVQLALPAAVLTLESADRRLPLVAALLFLGGTRLEAARSRASRAVLASIVLLFLARMAGVAAYWSGDQAAYEDAREVMASAEPGSRVLTGYPDDAMDGVRRSVAVYYVPVWETVRRGGFSPGLFAYRTQQPVRRTAAYEELAHALAPQRVWACLVGPEPPALTAAERAALARYDYVVLVDGEPFRAEGGLGLVPVAERPRAKLYRVR